MKSKSICALLFGALTASCNSSKEPFKSVSVDDFASFIEDADVQRLDVRTPDEFSMGHLQHAINIDVTNSDFESRVKKEVDAQKPVAVYCRSGRRSKLAAQKMVGMGYKVVELNTGYMGWEAADMPIVFP